MARLFGTDGVRGVANESLTAELAFKLGFAGAKVLTKTEDKKPVILIGMDTRISGKMLEAALAAGICSAGADAVTAGVIPTPGVAYLTRTMGFSAGVMISASHNSFEYNGIKFFSCDGYKLPDAVEDEIEEIINNFDANYAELKTGADVGTVTALEDAADKYTAYLKDAINVDATGLKIAIDCANGASSAYAQKLFEQLGAECVVIGNKPDGININDGCGSTHMEILSETVVKEGCDMGFAFDGDADRFLATDGKGELINGDKVMFTIASAMKQEGKLNDNTLVVTVMSNLGLTIAANEAGLKLAKTKVGDRYVLEEMRDKGFNVGGEQSGHVILSDHSTTGDGMLTALAFLKSLKTLDLTAEEAASKVKILPQVLLPAYVKNSDKEAAMQSPKLKALTQEYEQILGDTGRILIRPSGTEPQIRVMLEGENIEQITKMAEALVAAVNEDFKPEG